MRIAACALLLALAACAGSQHPAPTPSGPVSLGLWCEEVTATLCHATAERCNKGIPNFEAGCQEAARASCVAGRERTVSAGRTDEELRTCVKALKKLDCPGLGGSGDTLTTMCSAKVAATN